MSSCDVCFTQSHVSEHFFMWYRSKTTYKVSFWTSSWMMHKGYSNKLVPITFPAFALCIWASLAHKRYIMESDVWWSQFSAYTSLLWAAVLGGRLPFVSVLFGWVPLVSCLSIKRSVRMSMQSQLVWLERFPLVFPYCQTPFPAEVFGLMMQQVRGHYPLETCLKGCCSPRFLGWQH